MPKYNDILHHHLLRASQHFYIQSFMCETAHVILQLKVLYNINYIMMKGNYYIWHFSRIILQINILSLTFYFWKIKFTDENRIWCTVIWLFHPTCEGLSTDIIIFHVKLMSVGSLGIQTFPQIQLPPTSSHIWLARDKRSLFVHYLANSSAKSAMESRVISLTQSLFQR